LPLCLLLLFKSVLCITKQLMQIQSQEWANHNLSNYIPGPSFPQRS
jgi:hypothetical protein